MTWRNLLLLLIIFGNTHAAVAVERAELSSQSDLPDWRISAFYQPVFTLFTLTPGGSNAIDYEANGAEYAGLGLRYKDFDLSVSFPIPFYPDNTGSRGETSQQVFSLGKSFEKHRIEFYFGHYAGFYGRLDADTTGGYSQRPDIDLDEASLKYTYSLWSSDFSFRSFDSFQRGQKYSASSLNLIAEYHQSFLRGSTPLANLDASAPSQDPLLGVRSNSLGVGLGYSFVHANGNAQWYLDGAMAVGPQREEVLASDGGRWQTSVVGFFNVKGAYTYAFEILNLGLSLDYGSTFSQIAGDGIWTHVFLPELYIQKWF